MRVRAHTHTHIHVFTHAVVHSCPYSSVCWLYRCYAVGRTVGMRVCWGGECVLQSVFLTRWGSCPARQCRAVPWSSCGAGGRWAGGGGRRRCHSALADWGCSWCLRGGLWGEKASWWTEWGPDSSRRLYLARTPAPGCNLQWGDTIINRKITFSWLHGFTEVFPSIHFLSKIRYQGCQEHFPSTISRACPG